MEKLASCTSRLPEWLAAACVAAGIGWVLGVSPGMLLLILASILIGVLI